MRFGKTGYLLITACAGLALFGLLQAQNDGATPTAPNPGVRVELGYAPLIFHHRDPLDITIILKNETEAPLLVSLAVETFDEMNEPFPIAPEKTLLHPPSIGDSDEGAIPARLAWTVNLNFEAEKAGKKLRRIHIKTRNENGEETGSLNARLVREYDDLKKPGEPLSIERRGQALYDAQTSEYLIFVANQPILIEDRSWVWAKWIYKEMVDHKIAVERVALLSENLCPDDLKVRPFYRQVRPPEPKGGARTAPELQTFILPKEERLGRPILSAMLLFERDVLPFRPDFLVVFLGSSEQGLKASKPHEYMLLIEWIRHRVTAYGGKMAAVSPIAAPKTAALADLKQFALDIESSQTGADEARVPYAAELEEAKSLLLSALDAPESELSAKTQKALAIIRFARSKAETDAQKLALTNLSERLGDPEKGLVAICSTGIPNGVQEYTARLLEYAELEEFPLWRLDRWLYEKDLSELKELKTKTPNPAPYFLCPNLSWRLRPEDPDALWRYPNERGQKRVAEFINAELEKVLYAGEDTP